MSPHLYRSRSDVMLGGVCAGLAGYFGLDPTLVRIIFVLLALGTGFGVFLYILLWIVVPAEGSAGSLSDGARGAGGEMADRARDFGREVSGAFSRPNPRMGAYFGMALIVLGLIWLAQSLDVSWLRWLNSDLLWPALLIVGGIALILRRTRGE
jgi:phage shock protein PspC (stress-responsive transcriptional regulator)